jgi:hypothetical protein
MTLKERTEAEQKKYVKKLKKVIVEEKTHKQETNAIKKKTEKKPTRIQKKTNFRKQDN